MTPKNRFSENILESGGVPCSRVLRSTQMVAPDSVAELLSLSAGEMVYYFEILRLVNDKPFLISSNFATVKNLPGFLERLEGFISLFRIYTDHYGITLRRGKTTIYASFPTPEEAVSLQIPANMPVLKVGSVLRSQDDQLIQYTVSCYRSDRAKLDVGW